MSGRAIIRLSSDHPITISPATGRLQVTAKGTTLADTGAALALAEADYPVVTYLPRADIDMTRLQRSDHTSWCSYKGEATYFDLVSSDGARVENVAWSYESPAEDVVAIKDHLAFYADRVDVIDAA